MSPTLSESILASSIVLLAFLAVMGVVYTVWSSVKMRKKRKYFEELHVELAPGQEVVFGGGIYGTVKRVDGDKVEVQVRSGAVMDVSRYAIQQISQSK